MKIIVAKDPLTALTTIIVNQWRISYYSQRASYKETPNEDAMLIQAVNPQAICMAVADGVGSTKDSFKASAGVLNKISQSIQNLKDPNDIRNTVLQSIETINQKMVKHGDPATTLTLALILQKKLHIFQIGDSSIFLCGQRGKLKYRSTMHSPTGYAIEAGMLTEKQAQTHPHNHIVDNIMGIPAMHVEMSTAIPVAEFDTIFLASDGIFDNFTTEKLVDIVRKRRPEKCITQKIINPCQTLYQHKKAGMIKKDDDISFIVAQHI